MNIILTMFAVAVTVSILSALVLFMFSLPTIVKGYRQRREDEYHLAEYLSAQVKANRHRDIR